MARRQPPNASLRKTVAAVRSQGCRQADTAPDNTAGLSPAGYPPRGRLLASLFARASLRGPQTGSWITPSLWPRPWTRPLWNLGSLDKPEAVIVVAIRRRVPVAVRRTQIPRIIVPGAAAHDGLSFDRFPARSHPLEYHPGKYLLQQGVAVGVMSMAQSACHGLAHRVTRYPPLPVARGEAL